MQKQKKIMSANEIRSAFLEYFREKHHEIVSSSSLIPSNDPTLLFTNAGMVQFKDVFLGKEERTYKRAASSQRCVRAGGKHNDLERVGLTARHHTFFEMLGNFSFGDYFKKQAIEYAWQFLTEHLNLPKEKLWITVFTDDHEAADIWLKHIKIDPTRFSRCGEDSNFWSMGATGPCGPCTEIFYDHGAHIPGGPPGTPEEDGDRYVEIWNLVFMQYNRAADGAVTPLPKPSVDTGMGLERITAVLQGVSNNYDTDLFKPLISAMAEIAKIHDLTNSSLRVIADHIRASAFLISDGIVPSNEGRGYVLRRIIRRAIRHGHKLGINKPFFYLLQQPLVDNMGKAYPELIKNQKYIEKTLKQEEEQFNVTLNQGLKLFEEVVTDLNSSVIPGSAVFKLYDTYGFPVDLTADMARERNLSLDYDGFETAMSVQRERSRKASKFEGAYEVGAHIETPTEFIGDKNLLIENAPDQAKIIALYRDQTSVNQLKEGENGIIILDRTPFYAESGGQVGDQGMLYTNNSTFKVTDTQKQGVTHAHIGLMTQGSLKINDLVSASVDGNRRAATVLNHTATHLLHRILRETLGDHVIQKGSLVEPERLRFDFSHPSPLTLKEINRIEHRVNDEIRLNHEAIVQITTPEKAIESGAMALFGEKYGDEVRMVRFGESLELCGGTHAHHTGEIGLFKITAESGIASGVRRIEAVTGKGALLWLENKEIDYQTKLQQMEAEVRHLEKQLLQLKDKLASSLSEDLSHQTREINGVKVLSAKVENLDPKSLRNTVDQLKNKLGTAIIVLAIVTLDKVHVVVGVTKNLTTKINAHELVNMIAKQIGGKGGGRPDLAEAGGNLPGHIDAALASIEAWVKAKL